LPALAALGNAALPLKAVYSRSEKSSRELAEAAVTILNLKSPPSIYHDEDPSVNIDALLARKDIIAITIALPIPVQPKFISKSLEAGKHVLSEKPIAPDIKQALDMIDSYHQLCNNNKGLVWKVAEDYEAEPGYRAAAAAVQSGKIGKVIFFKAFAEMNMNKDSKWYKRPWRTVPDVSLFHKLSIYYATYRTIQYQGGFLVCFLQLESIFFFDPRNKVRWRCGRSLNPLMNIAYY
jgi:predicted dehydrogenase